MSADNGQEAAEIKRLRYLDHQHRVISENAEAETRDIRIKTHAMSKELSRLGRQIRAGYHDEEEASKRESDWAGIDRILDELAHL